MDYRACAEEWMACMIASEERGAFVQKHLTELAHGELAVLHYLAGGHDGASAKTLSERFRVNTSRIAAILNSLVKKGYVYREASAQDGRMISVFITEAGSRYAATRREDFLSHCTAMLEKLGPEDAGHYVRIMRRLSELLTEYDESGET